MNVVIACICGRHDSDTVTLRDTLDFRAAVTVRNAIGLAQLEDGELSVAETLAILKEQYLLVGIERWTLMNGAGPLPVSKATIREHLLSHIEEASVVADAADDLYSAKVVLPLLVRAASSSPTMPMDGSTSATSAGRSRRPKPSSPSSTITTPTDATGTTSSPPAGDSN